MWGGCIFLYIFQLCSFFKNTHNEVFQFLNSHDKNKIVFKCLSRLKPSLKGLDNNLLIFLFLNNNLNVDN